MQDPVLHQAIAAWEKSSDDPNVREEYFARRKAVLDEKAAVREAELRLREAIQKGMAEGRASYLFKFFLRQRQTLKWYNYQKSVL